MTTRTSVLTCRKRLRKKGRGDTETRRRGEKSRARRLNAISFAASPRLPLPASLLPASLSPSPLRLNHCFVILESHLVSSEHESNAYAVLPKRRFQELCTKFLRIK